MKTTYQYSNLDYSGQKTWSELKVRTKNYHPAEYCMKDSWILPAAKFIEGNWCLDQGKDVWFFYLFECDGSLWALKYDPAFMVRFKLAVPEWHQDNQLHYFVPQENWTKIGSLKIDDFKASAGCQIQDD